MSIATLSITRPNKYQCTQHPQPKLLTSSWYLHALTTWLRLLSVMLYLFLCSTFTSLLLRFSYLRLLLPPPPPPVIADQWPADCFLLNFWGDRYTHKRNARKSNALHTDTRSVSPSSPAPDPDNPETTGRTCWFPDHYSVHQEPSTLCWPEQAHKQTDITPKPTHT